MELYRTVSYTISKLVTSSYSTSFGLSIKLFSAELRPHIYAIYGLVRLADEIVDTYRGPQQRRLLERLETDTIQAVEIGYSTNPLVYAFAMTARQYHIGTSLITPFFDSMRMDIDPQPLDQSGYTTYIYGSAEVVGLMCLNVFVEDTKLYDQLRSGARSLGAAYQKINFLRDIATDTGDLHRWYFPIGSADNFDDATKAAIIDDIETDLAAAAKVIPSLPRSSRKAVQLSYYYYNELLHKMKLLSARDISRSRTRLSDVKKITLLISSAVRSQGRV